MHGQEEPYLQEILARLGLFLNLQQQQQLVKYVHLIMEGLARQRLVGTRNMKELISKHIFDSLYPVSLKIISAGELLDLGTGAGLPGIPLKISLPELKLYLMDSNRRKMFFLQRVCDELNLHSVFFLSGRAEEWAWRDEYRERFPLVVSRAVAEMPALVELTLPLAAIGGTVLLYKGPRGETEADAASEALRICGGSLKNIYRYTLPTGEERTLVQLLKIKKTPAPYPRQPGKPAKKPLL